MKISLNQANKIRNKLETTSFYPNTMYTIRTDNTNSNEENNKQIKEFEEGYQNLLNSINHIFTLRSLINDTNHKEGITPIIAEIACKDRIIKSLQKLLDSVSTAGYPRREKRTYEDFLGLVEYLDKAQKADPTNITRPEAFIVSILDDERVEEIKKYIEELVLEREELETKRNELNYQTVIELPKDVVDFLRDNRLIK